MVALFLKFDLNPPKKIYMGLEEPLIIYNMQKASLCSYLWKHINRKLGKCISMETCNFRVKKGGK